MSARDERSSTDSASVRVQSERSLRKEDSDKVLCMEAALQEAHNELKAEKLLLQQVCLLPQASAEDMTPMCCFAASHGVFCCIATLEAADCS